MRLRPASLPEARPLTLRCAQVAFGLPVWALSRCGVWRPCAAVCNSGALLADAPTGGGREVEAARAGPASVESGRRRAVADVGAVSSGRGLHQILSGDALQLMHPQRWTIGVAANCENFWYLVKIL